MDHYLYRDDGEGQQCLKVEANLAAIETNKPQE